MAKGKNKMSEYPSCICDLISPPTLPFYFPAFEQFRFADLDAARVQIFQSSRFMVFGLWVSDLIGFLDLCISEMEENKVEMLFNSTEIFLYHLV